MTVQGTNQGRTVSTNVSVNVVVDLPTAQAPACHIACSTGWGLTDIPVRDLVAGGHRPVQRDRGLRSRAEQERRRLDPTIARRRGPLDTTYTLKFATSYRFRVRAVDAGGNWSPWV